MRARILPTDGFAEFGKTDTVIVVLSVNSTEAHRILDDLVPDSEEHPRSASTHYLEKVLTVVASRPLGGVDRINNDGRYAGG